MGDFFLDLRLSPERQLARAVDTLRFSGETSAVVIEESSFGLVMTFTGEPGLWAPYRAPDGSTIAIAGRVALDEDQWKEGEAIPGPGGIASKALYAIFRKRGLGGVEDIGGNRVVLVYDAPKGCLHLVADPVGAFPAFSVESADPNKVMFGSHPDVLAKAAGEGQNLDEVSMTEFLLTSTVTPPFTYYRPIRFVSHGTTTTIKLVPGCKPEINIRQYFEINLQSDASQTEDDLADELAQAFRVAVRRRTLPRLGRTAVALSGGLDSRALLACVENKEQVFAFCCYNEPNRELATAEAIARSCGVPFFPWQRDFEYYGRNAAAGVRIAGGMGTFANNHFLGVVERLRAEGAQNLLTGCYCDYLFKGLALNRETHWLTGRERIAPFRHEFYFSHNLRPSPMTKQILERLEARVPARFQAQQTASDVFQVEAHRTFPLCYEGDNQQRVVPQRVTGWYLPVADRAILDVYRKIPSHLKLNRSIYTKAVRGLCNGTLSRIPDANTGARVGASLFSEAVHHNWSRVCRKLRSSNESISTDGSWPNWDVYVRRSEDLRRMWTKPHQSSADFFRRVLSPKDIRPDTADYRGEDIWLMIPMLTLKLWFEQWQS